MSKIQAATKTLAEDNEMAVVETGGMELPLHWWVDYSGHVYWGGKAGEVYAYGNVIRDAEGRVVANCNKAYSYLISAAPDLLEAAKTMVHKMMDRCHNSEPPIYTEIEELQKVIEQAEGV